MNIFGRSAATGEATTQIDVDFDGTLDTWETYEEDRMASRVVDRNNDGVKDAFYVYEGDSLVEERHDANNDGKIDLDGFVSHRLTLDEVNKGFELMEEQDGIRSVIEF